MISRAPSPQIANSRSASHRENYLVDSRFCSDQNWSYKRRRWIKTFPQANLSLVSRLRNCWLWRHLLLNKCWSLQLSISPQAFVFLRVTLVLTFHFGQLVIVFISIFVSAHCHHHQPIGTPLQDWRLFLLTSSPMLVGLIWHLQRHCCSFCNPSSLWLKCKVLWVHRTESSS